MTLALIAAVVLVVLGLSWWHDRRHSPRPQRLVMICPCCEREVWADPAETHTVLVARGPCATCQGLGITTHGGRHG